MKRWIKEIILTTGLQVKGIQKGNEIVAAINTSRYEVRSGTDKKYAPLLKRLKVNLTSDVKK
jgi:hypothetical protein